MPENTMRIDRHMPGNRLDRLVTQEDPHEQHDRTAEPGDPASHARRRSFPDGNSALMLICARIRYVTANEWSTRRYLDMSRLDDNLQEAN